MRVSVRFMYPLFAALLCVGLAGCSESESDAASTSDAPSASSSEPEVATSPSTGSDAAAEESESLAGPVENGSKGSNGSEFASGEEKAAAQSTVDEQSSDGTVASEKVDGKQEEQGDSEEKPTEANADAGGNASPATGQTAKASRELPENLQWLESWKDGEGFEWLSDWKTALKQLGRPLVLRPDTPWPDDNSREGRAADSSETAAKSGEADDNRIAQAASESGNQ